MVANPSKAETLAALLTAVPGVLLGIDLPERPLRSSGGTAEPTPRIRPVASRRSGRYVDLDNNRPAQQQPEGFDAA